MIVIDNIGVALDFSEQSELAYNHAQVIARSLGARIVLLHVAPEELARQPGALELDQLEQLVESDLDRRVAACVERGMDASAQVLEGDAVSELARATGELGLGLLVLGTHSRTGFNRLLLGNVAEQIARLAPCPVLVTRGEAPSARGYQHILVPTDFSSEADHALETAVAMAGPNARIDMLHCWEEPSPVAAIDVTSAAYVSLRAETIRDIHRAGELRRDRYASNHDVEIELIDREGATRVGIQQVLEDTRYELVVLGSHGRTGLRRWLLGSVAEATARHAPCSALIVKSDHGREDRNHGARAAS